MVFRRRDPRSWLQTVVEFFYPRGGWRRAATYVIHRVRRLPDAPHRIGRGVFAGVFVSFTPFFGLHFILAALLAWTIRGNVLAALLATFFGNPITTPLIAFSSVELGHLILGSASMLTFDEILQAFGGASGEIWRNIIALFTDGATRWAELLNFWRTIFLPYLVGGFVPGVIVATVCHYATLPVIAAYKRRRARKLHERIERLRALAEARHRDRTQAPPDGVSM